MLTGVFEDARFGPFSNLHTCISVVEVYRFGQCLDWRFWPKSIGLDSVKVGYCRPYQLSFLS